MGRFIIATALVSSLCVNACGGGSGGGGDMRPDPVVARVDVSGVPANLIPPGTAQLTATATFSNNSTQNVTTAATWESSNATIASVSAGVVTANAPGTVDIAAVYQGVRGTAGLSVAGATLRANPGGPYQTRHDTNVTFSGLASTSSPYGIAKFSWNCGQNVAANCDQEGPTPTFNYRRCANNSNSRPPCRAGSSELADYTVRLTITDTQGNTNTATTTVTVTNSY